MKVTLRKSPNPEKKYRVTFEDGSHVDFGGAGYSDYTIHKDPSRMKRYLARHGRMGETWSKAGLLNSSIAQNHCNDKRGSITASVRSENPILLI